MVVHCGSTDEETGRYPQTPSERKIDIFEDELEDNLFLQVASEVDLT